MNHHKSISAEDEFDLTRLHALEIELKLKRTQDHLKFSHIDYDFIKV